MSKIDCVENAYQYLLQKRKDAEDSRPKVDGEKPRRVSAGVTRETLQFEYDKIVNSKNYDPNNVAEKLIGVANERIRNAAKKRATTLLMYKAENDLFGFVQNNFGKDPVEGIISYMAGTQGGQKGSRASAYVHQQSLSSIVSSELYMRLNERGVWDALESGDIDDDIQRELFDISLDKPTGVATKNKEAKLIAEVIYPMYEKWRLRANRAGADIKRLQGYYGAQTHDGYKIRKSGLDEWKAEMRESLDYEKTFGRKVGDISEKDVNDVLTYMYKEFISGNHLRYSNRPPSLEFRKMGVNIGGSLSNERFFHFKDVNASINYAKKYGSGSFREVLKNSLSNIASKTALMERLGPNPTETITRAFAKIKESIPATDDKKLLKLTRNWDKIQNHLKVIDGTVNIPANDLIATATSVAMGVQTMAKLGGAPISAISDIATAASRLQFDGYGFFESYKTLAQNVFAPLSIKQRRELEIMFGIYKDHLLINMVNHNAGAENFSGKTAKAMNMFFKFTGLSGWTNIQRGAVTRAYSARLASNKNLKMSKLDDDIKRSLELFNITENDFSLFKHATMKADDGVEYVSPHLIDKIDDSIIAEIFGDIDPSRVRQDVRDKLQGYLIDTVEGAVLAPDARTMAMMRQGTQAGTVIGSFNRLIMQFKSFPTAFTQKVIGREVRANDKSMSSSAWGVASVMAQTTAMGYLAMTLKDLLKGREPRDPLAVSTWSAAMIQGGGLGIYGDFIIGNSNRFGGGIISTLAGPTLGEVEKVWKVYADLRDGKDPSGRTTSLIAGNIPFANVWWYKPAVDYLFLYQLQEGINPGSLRRMEKRIEEENKQEIMIKPSEVVPSGGLWGLNQ